MENKITVYSTPTCPYCIRLKQFLKERNLQFNDIDVSVDSQAADEIVRRTGQMGVPVVDIDGRIIIGFDRRLIEEALGLT
jgi:glutaredoxin 3